MFFIRIFDSLVILCKCEILLVIIKNINGTTKVNIKLIKMSIN